MENDSRFFLQQPMQALYKIGQGEPPDVPKALSIDARDFIHRCLQVDPTSRPNASQLLEHPFVKRPLTSSSGSASPRYVGRRHWEVLLQVQTVSKISHGSLFIQFSFHSMLSYLHGEILIYLHPRLYICKFTHFLLPYPFLLTSIHPCCIGTCLHHFMVFLIYPLLTTAFDWKYTYESMVQQ